MGTGQGQEGYANLGFGPGIVQKLKKKSSVMKNTCSTQFPCLCQFDFPPDKKTPTFCIISKESDKRKGNIIL